VTTAIFSTACCFGPLLLVTLGFSGAAAARMEALAPLQPFFAGATLLLLGWAFHALYIKPRRCAPGEACDLVSLRRQRIVFCFVVALIAALALFPAFSEYLY
jgi:mercuric ion transport protein